jgi:tetratricopeptide (TPR) repeat protein
LGDDINIAHFIKFYKMKKILLLLMITAVQLTAQDLKQSGLDKFNKQEWTAAAKDFNKYLKTHDKDSAIWYNLGKTYFNMEKFEEAIASYTMAKETNFAANFISYAMGKTYARMANESLMLAALKEGAENGLPIYTRLINDVEFEAYRNSVEFQHILEQVKSNAYPCLSKDDYRHFDFWLGDWDVFVNGNKVGENRITMAQGGCAIHENYTTAGNYAGQSINYFDPIAKKWHQHWVGSGGDVYNYLETKKEDGLLQFESDFMGPSGQISLSRLTFSRNADGSVRQLFESSTDDGKTWSSAFDGLYKKME